MKGQPSERLLTERWTHLSELHRVLPVPARVTQGRPAAFCLELSELQDVPIPAAFVRAALRANRTAARSSSARALGAHARASRSSAAQREAALASTSVDHKLVLSLFDTRSKAFFGRQTTAAHATVRASRVRA